MVCLDLARVTYLYRKAPLLFLFIHGYPRSLARHFLHRLSYTASATCCWLGFDVSLVWGRMSRQAHEWLKSSALAAKNRSWRPASLGRLLWFWAANRWLVSGDTSCVPCFSRARRTGGCQFVDRASMHSTIVPRMQRHAYLSLNETVLEVSSHN